MSSAWVNFLYPVCEPAPDDKVMVVPGACGLPFHSKHFVALV